MLNICRLLALIVLSIAAAAQPSPCYVAIVGGLAIHDKTASMSIADPATLPSGHAVDGIQTTWAVGSSGLLVNSTGTYEPVPDLLIFDPTGHSGCFNTGSQVTVIMDGVVTSPPRGTLLDPANLDVYDSNGFAGLAVYADLYNSGSCSEGSCLTSITITVIQAGTSGSTPLFPSNAATGGVAGAAVRVKNLRFDVTTLPSSTNQFVIVPASGYSVPSAVVNAATMTPQIFLAAATPGIMRPWLSTYFGASSIAVNGTTSLVFTITNPNTAITLNGFAFSNTLPDGLVVANPSGISGTCGGGTFTAPAGSNAVFLTGATLTPAAVCNLSVNLIAATPGLKKNDVSFISTTTGGWATSTAYLSVSGELKKRRGQITSQ